MTPRKKKILVIVLRVLAIPALIVAVAALYLLTETEIPLTESDRRILIGPADIEPYLDGFRHDPGSVVLKKVKAIDDSVEIDLDYSVDTEGHPYVNCTLYYDQDKLEAVIGLPALWESTRLRLNLADTGFDFLEDDDFFTYGDKSRFAFIMSDGRKVGSLFITVVGHNTYYLLIVGLYFEDADTLKELLLPKLSQLGDYK